MKSLNQINQYDITIDSILNFFKNEKLDFKPGEKFEYNNSGYFLLGYIIEKISGLKYGEFLEKSIFNVIGMSQSTYVSDQKIIKQRANGYHIKDSIYINKKIINYNIPFSAGALMSSVTDMLKWQNALNSNKLIDQEISKKAFINYRSNNGTEIPYGYGWHIKEMEGIETREHGGSIFGFKSMAVYVPLEDIYVIGLTNCDCISPTDLVKDIARLVLKNGKL